MAVIAHVLGDADLGVRPARDAEGVAERKRINELLLSGAIDDKKSLLTGSSRDEGQHRAFRPLESTIAHIQIFDDSLLGSGSDRIVLIATQQNPPHPGDTAPIAHAFTEVAERDGGLFGIEATVEVVIVPEMAADAFASAVREAAAAWYRPDGSIDEVIVGIAGGPVTATIGVIGGLVGAGIVPKLIESNRQDRNLEVEAPLLAPFIDVKRRLARTRQYEALRALLPVESGDERWLCRQLHQATIGSWPAEPPPRNGVDKRFVTAATALDVPRWNNGDFQAPATANQWDGWRKAVERVVVGEIARGEPTALPLMKLALACRINSEAFKLGTELDAERQHIQQNPNAGGERLHTAGDVVMHRLFIRRHRQGRTAAALNHLMTENRAEWSRIAAAARHRLAGDRLENARKVLVDERVTGRGDAANDAVRLLGYVPPAPLDADRQLVLMCVGMQNRTENDPMANALLAHFGDRPIEVMLLASGHGERGTVPVAEALVGQIAAEGRRATVVECDDVASIEAARSALTEAVAAADRFDVTGVHVVAGPGSKAFNVAATLVGIEESFALAVPMALLSLKRIDNDDTEVVPVTDALPGWQRLVGDADVAIIVRDAIQRLDLGLARSTIGLAGPAWNDVRDLVQQLTEQLEASLKPRGWIGQDDDPRRSLVAARLQQWFRRQDEEPLLTVARLATTISDVFRDGQNNGADPWHRQGGAVAELWAARNEVFHRPWDPVQLRCDLNTLLNDLGLELPAPSPITQTLDAIEKAITAVVGEPNHEQQEQST